MNVFDSIGETTDKATDIGETYFKASHQYLRLKIFQQLSLSVSMVTKLVVISAFLFLGLVFCAVAAAMAIGEALENILFGYLIVGAFFMFIAILIYWSRAIINIIVLKKIGNKFFS